MNRSKYFFLFSIFFLAGSFESLLFAKGQSTSSFSTTPWSIRMAKSDMGRQSSGYRVGTKTWDYVIGTELKGFEQLWRATRDAQYFQYIQKSVDLGVNSSGKLSTNYSFTAYTLDNINEGKILLLLYNELGTAKYKIAADTLRKQLSSHPRVSEGGFWHKKAYPNQMWLDGLYMASPFYAEYGKLFNDTAAFTDAVKQFVIMENHARDSVTSLLYHGWNETKSAQWADLTTGCSPNFWGRAIGWYTVALVDVLDYLPTDHPGRAQLIAILQRLAVGIKKYQDSTNGTWYQVMDQGDKPDNWREASASSMFVYALAKGVRLGYINQSYLSVAKKGYAGILNEFITMNGDSTINLTKICSSAGLDAAPGGQRDGSYNYYVNNGGTQPVINDGKGTGPFIMASVELEMMRFIVPPINFHSTFAKDSVSLTWIDKSYNAVSFVIERKRETEANFTQIGEVAKGTTLFIDRSIQKDTKYYYHVKAKSDTSYSDYSSLDSVTTSTVTSINDVSSCARSFVLLQNHPNPFNPITQIEFSIKEKGFITLKVCDILGRDVAMLFNGYAESGKMYRTEFQASQMSSGTYFSILQSGTQRVTKKMLLSK
jgi:unsaturated rhamnogalacturonyl hydrolase